MGRNAASRCFSQNSVSPLMVAGTVARPSSPKESRYIYCQNESKINMLYCWESKMLETMSQMPPSQTWLKEPKTRVHSSHFVSKPRGCVQLGFR